MAEKRQQKLGDKIADEGFESRGGRFPRRRMTEKRVGEARGRDRRSTPDIGRPDAFAGSSPRPFRSAATAYRFG